MKVLLVPISIAAFISAIFLCIKMVQIKNYSILGSILSRLFVGYVYLHAFLEGGVMHVELIVGILLIFISDILYHITYQISRKKQVNTCLEFVTRMKDIAAKLNTVLDTSFVPFFTIDMEGRIEYVNQALADLVEKDISSLKGKLLAEELGLTCDLVADFKESHQRECFIRKANNEYSKAIIAGNMTRNGHDTITGSIHLI